MRPDLSTIDAFWSEYQHLASCTVGTAAGHSDLDRPGFTSSQADKDFGSAPEDFRYVRFAGVCSTYSSVTVAQALLVYLFCVVPARSLNRFDI